MWIIFIFVAIIIIALLYVPILEKFTANSKRPCAFIGYSQSSSKPLHLSEADKLMTEGFNSFCIMGSDFPYREDRTDEQTAQEFVKRYIDLKVLGEKHGIRNMLFKVSIETAPTQQGLDWARTIIKAFKKYRDVLFYFDEPFNSVEENRYTIEQVRWLLNNLFYDVLDNTSNCLIIGLQHRLLNKFTSAIPVGCDIATSSYHALPSGRRVIFVSGHLWYHWFIALRYKFIKQHIGKLKVLSVWLYQGDVGWFCNLLNNFLRKRFIRVFTAN